jgi:hypothetical protein
VLVIIGEPKVDRNHSFYKRFMEYDTPFQEVMRCKICKHIYWIKADTPFQHTLRIIDHTIECINRRMECLLKMSVGKSEER